MVYNTQKDALQGFSFNSPLKFADHVLVFMVKGIKQNFKQPIAYYFTAGLKKFELKNLIKTVIKRSFKSGLIIINTLCDQSTVNVGAITELINLWYVSLGLSTYLHPSTSAFYNCFC